MRLPGDLLNETSVFRHHEGAKRPKDVAQGDRWDPLAGGGIIDDSCFVHLVEAGKGLLFWRLRRKRRAFMVGG